MNAIKKGIIAAAIVAAFTSAASAQPLLVGGRIEFGVNATVTRNNDRTADAPLIQFSTADGRLPLMEIANDGSVEFFGGATIDFAGFAPDGLYVNPTPRWVAVRVAGRVYLMPVYAIGRPARSQQGECSGGDC